MYAGVLINIYMYINICRQIIHVIMQVINVMWVGQEKFRTKIRLSLYEHMCICVCIYACLLISESK